MVILSLTTSPGRIEYNLYSFSFHSITHKHVVFLIKLEISQFLFLM